MMIAAIAPKLIARLGQPLSQFPINPLHEISPETMGAVP